MEEDEITKRKSPPEKESEWAHVWDGIDKAHKSWTVTGPIHAAISNWKAWLGIIAFLAWFNRPEITEAINTIIGGAK